MYVVVLSLSRNGCASCRAVVLPVNMARAATRSSEDQRNTGPMDPCDFNPAQWCSAHSSSSHDSRFPGFRRPPSQMTWSRGGSSLPPFQMTWSQGVPAYRPPGWPGPGGSQPTALPDDFVPGDPSLLPNQDVRFTCLPPPSLLPPFSGHLQYHG